MKSANIRKAENAELQKQFSAVHYFLRSWTGYQALIPSTTWEIAAAQDQEIKQKMNRWLDEWQSNWIILKCEYFFLQIIWNN